MEQFEKVTAAIKEALPDAEVGIYDLGGGNHLRVEVVSGGFAGKSLIQQHKMVHDILDGQMENRGGFIHALSIKTTAPKA